MTMKKVLLCLSIVAFNYILRNRRCVQTHDNAMKISKSTVDMRV